MKAREERSGAGPVETFVVIKNSNPQSTRLLNVECRAPLLEETVAIAEAFSIGVAGGPVKLSAAIRSRSNPRRESGTSSAVPA